MKVGFSFKPDIDYLLLILGIDSNLSDDFGRSIMYGLSGLTTIITVSYVGGLPFVFATFVLGILYWNGTDLEELNILFTNTSRFTFPSVAKVSLFYKKVFLKLVYLYLPDIWPNIKGYETVG